MTQRRLFAWRYSLLVLVALRSGHAWGHELEKPIPIEQPAVAAKVRVAVRFRAKPDLAREASERTSRQEDAQASNEPKQRVAPMDPISPVGYGEEEHREVYVTGQRASTRGASDVVQDRKVIEAAPYRTANDLLKECA